MTGPYAHMNLDHYFASRFERYARSFSGTIAGGTSEIQRNIIAQQVLGLPRRASQREQTQKLPRTRRVGSFSVCSRRKRVSR